MKMYFSIEKKVVFDEVAKNTAYIGAMNDAYEKVSTVEANADILQSFLVSACNEVACAAAAFAPVADCGEVEDEWISVNVTLPDTFDTNKRLIITNLLQEFFVAGVLWRWLLLAVPEMAPVWEMKTKDIIQKVVRGLNARTTRVKKPMRPF